MLYIMPYHLCRLLDNSEILYHMISAILIQSILSVLSLIECRTWLSGCRAVYIHCDMDQTQEEAASHLGVCSSF